MKQEKIKRITGTIKVATGLHIGAGSDAIEIGGMDDPIIRHPHTREPYIPGSSLKGKMRSLIEWQLGKVQETQGSPCNCGEKTCHVCRVFGASAASAKDKALQRGPTRLIIRDAMLSKKSRDDFIKEKPIVEEKHENTINRITADATPRQLERVVPGTTFDLDISFRVLDEGDEKLFKDVVLKALALLQLDYLGGGGSRGNGKIEFEKLKDENGQDLALPKA